MEGAMTFEEWLDWNRFEDSDDTPTRQAWDYQQQRIDELEALYHANIRCQCSDNDACKLLHTAPEGYVLVPVEPTKAIIDAGYNYVMYGRDAHASYVSIYKAMIQAAQEQE
jgi:hypothetical protein